jgi:hypothetical protein
VTREDCEEALTEVMAAATTYHGGVTDDQARAAVSGDAVGVWTPIYADLLAELAADLRSTGERYDRAAGRAGIPHHERFRLAQLPHRRVAFGPLLRVAVTPRPVATRGPPERGAHTGARFRYHR